MATQRHDASGGHRELDGAELRGHAAEVERASEEISGFASAVAAGAEAQIQFLDEALGSANEMCRRPTRPPPRSNW
jgi:hypothetical protein